MKKTILVDIDGTISDFSKRVHYLNETPKNWDKFLSECSSDEPIIEIVEMVKILSKYYLVIFLTGRSEVAYKKTLKWVKKYIGIDYSILMRPVDDVREDSIVKVEVLESFLGKRMSDIAFFLEDDSVMVKTWRSLGYKCLQVSDGGI